MVSEKAVEKLQADMRLVARLLAYQIAGKMTLAQGAPILRRLGMSPGEIAAVFDSTVNTVQVGVARAKKKGAHKQRARARA